MNGKMMFIDCSAKLRVKPTIFINLQNYILGVSRKGPPTGQSRFGTQLPRAEQWISNGRVSIECQDSKYRSIAKRRSCLPIFHPLNNLGKVHSNSGYKTNLQHPD